MITADDIIAAKVFGGNISSDKIADMVNRLQAHYQGNFPTKSALLNALIYPGNNDYAIVDSDETHSGETWRYSYSNDNGWLPQYRINEPSYNFEEGEVDGAFEINQNGSFKNVKIHGIRSFALGSDDEGEETEIIFDCGTAEDMLPDNS